MVTRYTADMDVLSQVLEGVVIRGSVFCYGEVRAPWCLSGGAEGACLFHAVVSGDAVAAVPGGETIPLAAGDLMLLTRGRQHFVASDLGLDAVALGDAVRRQPGGFARILSDGDGPAASLICGTFSLSEMPWHPLLSALPDVIVVRGHDTAWLRGTLAALDAQIQAGALGSVIVANRLAEILFVQAIAGWLRSRETDHAWIRGFGDPNIGRALAAIHARPGDSWTMEGLARTAGMSRSGFYRQFNDLLGEAPASYLKRWRMTLAARWLESRDRSLDQMSVDLGYSGVPAFSRAFKASFGVSPSEFRAGVGD